MNNLKSLFPSEECLCQIDAELCSVNTDVISEEAIQNLNLFLTPSPIIDDKHEILAEAILKHHHYRSFELSQRYLLKDENNGVYFTRRLKGAGLYSSPRIDWFHKRRNIMKDPTGLILGLQCKEEYDKSFENSKILRNLNIETEIPLGAFILKKIVLDINGQAQKVDIKKAFDVVDLPKEYQEIDFVIRIDAIGVNHRMLDYFNSDSLLLGEIYTKEIVQDMILKETELLLNYEMKLLNKQNLVFNLENDLINYLKFITSRIMKNIAILHSNNGIHDQLTTQNLTLDGKFIDYDTLEWITNKDEFEVKRKLDMQKLNNSLIFFLNDILKTKKYQNVEQLSNNILKEACAIYSELYKNKN